MYKCSWCKEKFEKDIFSRNFCSKECCRKFAQEYCEHPRTESTRVDDKLICNLCNLTLATGIPKLTAKIDPAEVIGNIKYEIDY